MLGMTACNDDFELPKTGDPDKAEHLAAGTYVGEWSRTNSSTGVVESAPGSIVFEVIDDCNNINSMTLVSNGLDLGVASNTSVCNISRNSSGALTYWNTEAKNPFGMIFTGSISASGEAEMIYTQIVRSGRKEVEFSYVFKGVKQ